MKLYTRTHVAVLGTILSLAVLAAGVLVTAYVLVPRAVQRALSDLPVRNLPAAAVTPVQYTASLAPTLKPGDLTDDELNNIQIYDRANKAVVYVTTVTTQYTWFYQAVQQEGTGSGVIIDQLGHVITNYHVINGADRIRITLADGSVQEGKIVGVDPENDLAVLQFNPKGKTLTTVPFGNSGGLRVGMKVLAIGNPFGLDRTLTRGIVSGLARPLQTEQGFMIRETIQTDAAINPGNSGGALLNSHSELIGINTAIKSPSGASAGVGFAIPSGTVKRIAEELIKYGAVRRGWIDIDPIELFPQLVDYFDLPVQKGVLVNTAGPTAQEAGIRGGDKGKAVRSGRQIIYGGGDIVTEVNGQPIESITDLYNALEDTKPGEIAAVKIVRGGQTRSLSVKLVEAPPQSQQ
ncbi:MAG: S1C family serine protease [Spirochaetia bacterium]